MGSTWILSVDVYRRGMYSKPARADGAASNGRAAWCAYACRSTLGVVCAPWPRQAPIPRAVAHKITAVPEGALRGAVAYSRRKQQNAAGRISVAHFLEDPMLKP